jgi:urease accessory protein
MVKPGAKVLMTSSSAQKVYKARAWQNQAINLTIRGDSMEWLPKETIVFPGAKARFHLNVEVGAKSRFMGWDLISLGAGQNFSRGSFFQELSLSRENRLIFRERGQIFGQDPFLKASLGFWDRSVAGLFWALGRAENDETKLLNDLKSQLINEIKIFDPTNAQNDLAGITVRDGLLLARYLGSSMERAWDWLEMIWRLTRGLWGGADFRPRLWST